MSWKITKVFDLQVDQMDYQALEVDLPQTPLPTGQLYDSACGYPHRFRLFDDDGYCYYEGQSVTCDDEAAFDPLDWAEADSGCTYIEYQQPNGKWEQL
jgi:hypothetical protein